MKKSEQVRAKVLLVNLVNGVRTKRVSFGNGDESRVLSRGVGLIGVVHV